jgi:low affinity Fe/Cu permease
MPRSPASKTPRKPRAPARRASPGPRKPRAHGAGEELSAFDRFAGKASNMVARAPFFAFCVLLVVLWLPSYFAFGNINTWQLIINTVTTIVTFLLVALLQNSQERSDQAIQEKLNAIADGVADVLAAQRGDARDITRDIKELRASVGLEDRESS